MKIDAKKFRKVFSEQWIELTKERGSSLAIDFRTDSTWTPHILSDAGLLKRISNYLHDDPNSKHRFGREWYTLDAVYVAGEDLFREDRNYPSEVSIIVEHENGPNVQEEMWKLIHWRAPLKVLIFYGYPDSSSEPRSDWAPSAVTRLWNMLDTVNAFHGESSTTEYLFLVGSLRHDSGLPEWRWATNNERTLQPLIAQACPPPGP